MSIASALYTGSSGLETIGNSIQVIGDNIANVNTVGFKGSTVEFADILSQTISGSGAQSQMGRGVRMKSINTHFTQGSLSSSQSETDLAINGAGFFVLSDSAVGTGQYYTRAGSFIIDKNGYLTNTTGLYVLGYQYDETGNEITNPAPINIGFISSEPNATGDGTGGTGVHIQVNLNANTTFDPSRHFDVTDPNNTSDYSTAVTVYDSVGTAHVVTVYFTKVEDPANPGVDNGYWEWNAVVDGSEITGGTPGDPILCEKGLLQFDQSGNLISQTFDSTAVPGTYPADFDFIGNVIQDQMIGFDFSNSTSYAGDSITSFLDQDGYSQGEIQGLSIGEDGIITGVFSNGTTREVARVVLANFSSEYGLRKLGDNLFIQTTSSGQPLVNVPGKGGTGTIASSSLELSNVDLTREFINLITAERGFQANSKVITTGDSMLQEIINIKR